MSDQIKVYFAGPLFTQAEWLWNIAFANCLRDAGFVVLLPQDNSISMMSGDAPFDPGRLFESNIADIESCDILLAVLDQSDPDSGTAWECGYAFGIGKPVLGIRSDFRTAGDDVSVQVNLMLARSCVDFVQVPVSKLSDTAWLSQEVTTRLRNIFERENPR